MKLKKLKLHAIERIERFIFTLSRSLKNPKNRDLVIKTALIISFVAMVIAEYFDSIKIEPKKDIENNDLKSKIGQMLMIGFRGTQAPADSYIAKSIVDINLGGVILFDYDVPSKSRLRNITDPEQTKKLVSDLKSYSVKEPLLVAIDAEGGFVNRLKPSLGFTDIPSAQKIGEKGTAAALESYWILAKQLSELGFNINFGPVVDVNINPKNPVIGGLERSYSRDPEKIAPLARAFVAAHRSFGIITSLKHFPGHGSSDNDSHLGLADVTSTYQQSELLPYEQLINDNAVDSVMTAHIINRAIDPIYPATLSPQFIQNILRQKLGFDGVIFSDDMQMGAIVDNYGFEDATVHAINAGCDILVFSNNGNNYDETVPYRARDIIFKAITDGRISEETVNQSYQRIMKLKEKI